MVARAAVRLWPRVRPCPVPLTGRRLWRLARAFDPEIGHRNAKRKRKTQTPFAFLSSIYARFQLVTAKRGGHKSDSE